MRKVGDASGFESDNLMYKIFSRVRFVDAVADLIHANIRKYELVRLDEQHVTRLAARCARAHCRELMCFLNFMRKTTNYFKL